MSRDPKTSEDELRLLLRDAGGLSADEKSVRKPKQAKTSEPTDLHALLREVGAPESPTSVRSFRSTQAADEPSIKNILKSSGTALAETQVQQPSATRKNAPAELQLDQVLREVQGLSPVSEARQHVRPESLSKAADLSETLNEVQGIKRAAPGDERSRDSFVSPWVARAGWIMFLSLLMSVAIWWQNRPLEGVAGVLQELADDVNRYRLQRGSLPNQLSPLENFPKNAVEWPIKYWNARDAKGRAEIIWVPNGHKHYRIVLRQGSEVWIYSDTEGKARLSKKN